MQGTTRRLLLWVVLPLALTIPLAIFMGYAALEHNPQEEFCSYVQEGLAGNYKSSGSPCLIKWGPVLAMVAVWMFVQMAVFTVLRVFWIGLRRKRNVSACSNHIDAGMP